MIEVYWKDTDETIVQLDYYAPVASWDEYHAAIDKSIAMAKTRDTTVHFLHNPGKTAMPRGNPLNELRRAYRRLPDNTGLIIMVINNTFAIHIVEMAIRILGFPRARLVSSLDEAAQLLKTQQAAE